MPEKASKIHSADEFGNYVHAVTIPMIIMMAAIVVFFAGVIAYCVFGHVAVSTDCVAVSDEECICYVKSDDVNDVKAGDLVKIDGEDYTVKSVASDATVADEAIVNAIGGSDDLELGNEVFEVTVDGDVPQGVHKATIVKGYINPLHALLES